MYLYWLEILFDSGSDVSGGGGTKVVVVVVGGLVVVPLYCYYLGGGGIGIGWKLENIIHNTTTNKYPDGRLALHQPVMAPCRFCAWPWCWRSWRGCCRPWCHQSCS